jgi:predicted acetyltransferase
MAEIHKNKVRLMKIFIEEVLPNEETILQNLFEFYDYEFSQYLDFEVNNEGLYRKAPVDKYLSEDSYSAYFIKSDGILVGFVIVNKNDSMSLFEIEQFFILKKHNGKGIGKQAAFEIFDRYKGCWKITQIEKNYSAQAFWRSVIKEYSNGIYIEKNDEKQRTVQEFVNR